MLRLYVDGVAVGGSSTDTRSAPPNQASARIGSFVEGYSTYIGVIDEAAVYGHALGADRIAVHFRTGIGP